MDSSKNPLKSRDSNNYRRPLTEPLLSDHPNGNLHAMAATKKDSEMFTFPSTHDDVSNEDPPSKLISSFLRKQKATGAELSLDMDLGMDDDDFRCSTEDINPQSIPINDNNSNSSVPLSGRLLHCPSSSSYVSPSGLLVAKAKSRLVDPPSINIPADIDRKSGRLTGKSGVLSSRYDDDDEDPFVDDDVPYDFMSENFSTLTILQWFSLVVILAALVCSLSIPVLERMELWDLHLWKWEVMVLVLICGRLVSGWGIRFVVYFVERNFLLRKRLLYFIYGVRKAVQNCLWLGLVLLVWHLMFDRKVDTKSNILPFVTKVIFCLLIASLLRLIKTLLVKVLASSFHVSTYFDRIQESLFNQYVIETLSGPPIVEMEEQERVMVEIQKLQNAGAKIPDDLRAAALASKSRSRSTPLGPTKSFKFSGPISKKDVGYKQEDGITIDKLHKLNQKNVSAWNMKRLVHIVRYGTLTTLDEQLGYRNGDDDSSVQIKSEHEAVVAAKKIFHNVAKPAAKHIYLPDLMRFMREDEALKTMTLFGGAESGRVSRMFLKNWVVNAFRERRHLALTLNDTKTAVNKLHQMANVVLGIIVISLWLLILNIADSHFFVVIGSQLFVAVFMFGNTLKMIFEAIIFLFAMHPFDVGDRCEIEGVQMIVEEMNILTTIFLRYDNLKFTYPNSVLATLKIANYYRSPDMGEIIDFCIHVSTPQEKIDLMKQRIISYADSTKEHWYPGTQVILKDVDDMNRLKVSIWLTQRMNFQDMGLRWGRREFMLGELIKILRDLDIEYRMLPTDVNVRKMSSEIKFTRFPSTWSTASS